MAAMRHFQSFLSMTLMRVISGCATQREYSGSFPKRLTASQNFWHFHAPMNPNLPSSPHPRSQNPQVQINPVNIQEILDDIVYVSPLRGFPVQARVVNDPKVNARTDGLVIYVDSGLLNAFHNQEETGFACNPAPEGDDYTAAASQRIALACGSL